MSGLEVVGALSGAAQLADAGVQIIKLISNFYSQIRKAPESLQKRSGQIELLIDIAHLIQETPPLQTNLISSLLHNCIQDAHELRDILEKLTAAATANKLEKYWKALGGVHNEKCILTICDKLEQEKNALTLCISSIDLELLHNIGTEVVITRQGIDMLLGALPQAHQTARSVALFGQELLTLKRTTQSIRDELSLVFEKVAQAEALSQNPQTPTTSGDPHQSAAAHETFIQSELPALRRVVESLARQRSVECMERKSQENGRSLNAFAKEKEMKCLASLAVGNQKAHLTSILRHAESAGQWFRESPRYKQWEQSNASDVLYLFAGAGCGQSTLVGHTVKSIQERHLPFSECRLGSALENDYNRPDIILYYFFQRNHQTPEGVTALAAVRTMTEQLVSQHPTCLPKLLNVYDLLSAREMIQELPRVFIVVDGVDECSSDSRMALILGLLGLLANTGPQAKSAKGIVKVLISGRPDDEIMGHLLPQQCIGISESDTVSDIRVLVRTRVSRFMRRHSLTLDIERALSIFLCSKSHGMFLWIVMVMDELERRDERLTNEALVIKLLKMPMTLRTTYASILECSPKSRQEDLWRILRWLLYSKRTLAPTVLEQALCKELELSVWNDFQGDVKFLCGSLVRINPNSVCFAHGTVAEFLLDIVGVAPLEHTGGIAMDPVSANSHIAAICVSSLLDSEDAGFMTEWLTDTFFRGEMSWEDFVTKNSFFAYAAEYWSCHLDKTIPFNRVLPALVTHYILEKDNNPNVEAENGESPLLWAAEAGSFFSAESLLNAGAAPSQPTYDGWTPLHWAASKGDKALWDLLIDHGADEYAIDAEGLTAKHWAVRRGHGGIDIAKRCRGFRSSILIDFISPSDSASVTLDDQILALATPKPHKCSKGKRCAKWKKQQNLIARFHQDLKNKDENVLNSFIDVFETRSHSELEIKSSIVASSDALGRWAPRIMLEKATLSKVELRDPQDNVKAFLEVQTQTNSTLSAIETHLYQPDETKGEYLLDTTSVVQEKPDEGYIPILA
ncbi:uncharacterized protein PAC_07877 [Phialocephala subalpina]|uniref:NACHT domain-containing protein n=1 Tax=Phialocephala subalpina TaxID=576137 RepID=A0A1L7WYY9_9HELO|nr:uncharacterized protein PAC_07877 [Phialocephala subalpina]